MRKTWETPHLERAGSRGSLPSITPGGVWVRGDPQSWPFFGISRATYMGPRLLSETADFLLLPACPQHHCAIHLPGGLGSIGKRGKFKGNQGQRALLLRGGLRQWAQPSAPGSHRPLLGPVVSRPAEVTMQAALPGLGQLRLSSGTDLLCLAATAQVALVQPLTN